MENNEDNDQTFRYTTEPDGSLKIKETAPVENTSPKPEKVPYTSQRSAASGALDAIDQYMDISNTKAKKDDDTIVDVKVHNPFHKILELLKDIKSKQSTTVSMRFTIPLIALPIVLLAAFQLGRAQTVCASRFTSQVGNIRILHVMAPVESTDIYSQLLSFFPDIPKFHKPQDLGLMTKTILVGSNGEVLNILANSKLDLSLYNNTPVILTGQLSPCTSTMTLDDEKNLTQTD